MRYPTILCTTALILLTACGGGTTVIQPAPTVEKISPPPQAQTDTLSIPLTCSVTQEMEHGYTLEQLPHEFPANGAVLEDGSPLYLLAQLPQEEVSLYGLGSGEGVLFQTGDELTAYDLYYTRPWSYLPQLFSGDYDADGQTELLLLTYTGSGTGVSSWTLSLLEREETGWRCLTLPDTGYYDLSSSISYSWDPATEQAHIGFGTAAVSVTLPDYVDSGESLEPYLGSIVTYEVEENCITAYFYVGLWAEEDIPYTTLYTAELKAQLIYDGQGFSLGSPTLSALED